MTRRALLILVAVALATPRAAPEPTAASTVGPQGQLGAPHGLERLASGLSRGLDTAPEVVQTGAHGGAPSASSPEPVGRPPGPGSRPQSKAAFTSDQPAPPYESEGGPGSPSATTNQSPIATDLVASRTGTGADVAFQGILAYADPAYGPLYLALREPRGTVVEICGPADCLTRTSTDFGPVLPLWQAGRIADVSAADFPRICGVPLRFGLCPGSYLVLKRPRIALPNTATGGTP